jgi:cell division septum initiation protein DivIVA
MDIQHLIDRLEDLIDQGRHIPMGKYTLIDEEKALGLIDQMRIAIPEQIEAANRVVTQRDKILAQATDEARQVLDQAHQQSASLLDKDNISLAARHQAENMLAQAQLDADRVRADADGYVVDVLRELESHLLRTLTVVRNGIAKVMQDREASQQARQHQQQAAPPPPPAQTATLTLPQREKVSVKRD